MQTPLPQDYNSKAYSTYYSNAANNFKTKNFDIGVKPRSNDIYNQDQARQGAINPLKTTLKDIYAAKPKQHSKYDYEYRNFKVKQIEVPNVDLKRI